MITPAYSQAFFRYRNDDGGEATATWKEAENTDIAIVDDGTSTTFRLRVAVEETAGGAENNASFSLQYDLNTTGYTDVGAQGGAEAINLAASSNVADADPTTDQIGGAGTFTAGEIAEDTNDAIATFAGNDHTEHEWVLELNAGQVAPGDTVDFRVLHEGATITYSVTPSIAVEAPTATDAGGVTPSAAAPVTSETELTAPTATVTGSITEAAVTPLASREGYFTTGLTVEGSVIDLTDLDGANDVAVDSTNTYAYVSSYRAGALTVVDVSTPTDPTVVGSVSDGILTYAQGVAVDSTDTYAYVVSTTDFNQDSELSVVDISTPTAPTVVGSVSSGLMNAPFGVAVDSTDTYAYVVGTGSDSLRVVDISTPTAPTVVGTVSDAVMEWPRDVAADSTGTYAYVVGENSDSLTVVDVSDTTAPTVVGSVSDTTVMEAPQSVAVDSTDTYAYVAAVNSDSLTVVDVSDTTAPTVVGSVIDSTLNGAMGVAVDPADTYAYVAAVNEDSLTVVDVSTPTDPTVVGTVSDETVMNAPREVAAGSTGTYAYVASEYSDSLTVVDVSTPTAPTAGEPGTITAATATPFTSTEAWEGSGLEITDAGATTQTTATPTAATEATTTADAGTTTQATATPLPLKERQVVEDFEDGDYAEYTVVGGDTNYVTVQSTTTYEGTYALEISIVSGNNTNIVTESLPFTPSAGDTVHARVRSPDAGDNNQVKIILAVNGDPWTDGDAYLIDVRYGDQILNFDKRAGGSRSTVNGVSTTIPTDEWLEVEFQWGTDGTHTITLWTEAGVLLTSFTATDSAYTGGGIGWANQGTGSTTGYYDYMYVEGVAAPVETEDAGATTQVTGTPLAPVGPIDLGESVAADWDSQQAQTGVVHEATAQTDYTDAGTLEKGYATNPVMLPQSQAIDILWLFQDPSGAADVTDFSPAGGRDGTLIGGPTLGVPGLLGRTGISGDGVDDSVQVSYDKAYTDWTLAFWVAPSAIPEAGTDNPDFAASNGSAGGAIDFQQRSDAPEIAIGGGLNIGIHLTHDISDWVAGEYHMVAYTQDNAGDTRYQYVDGSFIQSVTGLNVRTLDPVGGFSALARTGPGSSDSNYWPGDMAFLCLWDVRLSDAEIAQVYDVVAGTSDYTTDKK